MNQTVLFVDDDPNHLEALARNLRKTEFQVLTAGDLDQANHLLRTVPVDAVVSDELMPGVSGSKFLASVAQHYPDVVRIILTGHPNLDGVSNAINRGKVCHYLTKPCDALDLTDVLKKSLDERARAREALYQAQKMGTLGQFTSGIIHDFNNLLSIIIGFSECLLRTMDNDDFRRPQVEAISNAGDRAAGLTRQLLAFCRQDRMQAIALDLNRVISGIEKMLECLVGKKTKLEIILESNLPQVFADPGQLEQALLNLAVNARDAMPNGGKLTVSTATGFPKQPIAPETGQSIVRQHYVIVNVKDTGCGMDEETKKHMYEPFFTTKERGQGTGLGLAMVNGFIRHAGGLIEVDSSPGQGTTFSLYMPAVR